MKLSRVSTGAVCPLDTKFAVTEKPFDIVMEVAAQLGLATVAPVQFAKE